MRRERAGSALSQYLLSLLTVCLLLIALLCALLTMVTTRTFAYAVLSASEADSQHKIDWNAAQIQAEYGLSAETLAPLDGVCARYQAQLADAWHDFFRTDAESLPNHPEPLDERTMTALVMADEGFQSRTDEDMRRAIARDEVVYPLSQMIRRCAFPIRQSLTEFAATLAAQRLSLPRLLRGGEITGAVCLMAALLPIFCRRVRTGSTLTATGVSALLLMLPGLLLNLPGTLHALSPIAQTQGTRALMILGGVQGLFAIITLIPGILLLRRAHS